MYVKSEFNAKMAELEILVETNLRVKIISILKEKTSSVLDSLVNYSNAWHVY